VGFSRSFLIYYLIYLIMAFYKDGKLIIVNKSDYESDEQHNNRGYFILSMYNEKILDSILKIKLSNS